MDQTTRVLVQGSIRVTGNSGGRFRLVQAGQVVALCGVPGPGLRLAEAVADPGWGNGRTVAVDMFDDAVERIGGRRLHLVVTAGSACTCGGVTCELCDFRNAVAKSAKRARGADVVVTVVPRSVELTRSVWDSTPGDTFFQPGCTIARADTAELLGRSDHVLFTADVLRALAARHLRRGGHGNGVSLEHAAEVLRRLRDAGLAGLRSCAVAGGAAALAADWSADGSAGRCYRVVVDTAVLWPPPDAQHLLGAFVHHWATWARTAPLRDPVGAAMQRAMNTMAANAGLPPGAWRVELDGL